MAGSAKVPTSMTLGALCGLCEAFRGPEAPDGAERLTGAITAPTRGTACMGSDGTGGTRQARQWRPGAVQHGVASPS